jgi:hypothetical protein
MNLEFILGFLVRSDSADVESHEIVLFARGVREFALALRERFVQHFLLVSLVLDVVAAEEAVDVLEALFVRHLLDGFVSFLVAWEKVWHGLIPLILKIFGLSLAVVRVLSFLLLADILGVSQSVPVV